MGPPISPHFSESELIIHVAGNKVRLFIFLRWTWIPQTPLFLKSHSQILYQTENPILKHLPVQVTTGS